MFETRKQITEHFDVDDNGYINDAGKYEGEMLYVPYLWESGDGQETDEREFTFIITDSDRHQFPELNGVDIVRLYMSESGFIFEMQHPVKAG
jgi:hypothetical protein